MKYYQVYYVPIKDDSVGTIQMRHCALIQTITGLWYDLYDYYDNKIDKINH